MSFFQVGWSPIIMDKSNILALKYRPQVFDDLIGHEEISTSIYNSININKAPNAFLFTGIRGIGKTTFARIVAKGLNCNNGIQKLCSDNFCSNCKSIMSSNHIDVLEIDAASRTGVDDVRELIEFSRYQPSIAKFKIFIIDEVHMLSKQAFNALLKTLEEPPTYLKFIFATTEVKKIPVTIISRCQRYNLSRIKSEDLFNFIKNICIKEKKKIEDKALKLLVKISEGSVRDALSLLDRALVSNEKNLLTFENVQKIFGYVDKSSYLDLIELILKGDESSVLNHYRNLYNSGVEPNNFLNEFLETLYYIKNISFISIDGSNFSLNDNDFKKISLLSKEIKPSHIMLFWQFTLKTIKEIDLVSNPNLSIEMFLIQLMYLNNKNSYNDVEREKINNNYVKKKETEKVKIEDPISQIKNLEQLEEKIVKKYEPKLYKIETLQDIIKVCLEKKEMQLKYDLENNVNLVAFNKNKLEISYNEKLDKDFVKNLSEKLFLWTNLRWIILFSNKKGDISLKMEKDNSKEKELKEYKNSNDYLKLSKIIPDIELIEITKNND